MEVKQIIQHALQHAVKAVTGQDVTVSLERPKEESHGDYASSVALAAFKQVKGQWQSPFALAEAIADALQKDKNIAEVVESVTAIAPGFINFSLGRSYLSSRMVKVLSERERYGLNKKDMANRKVMVEYTDPNPFKEFHIGHLYSNIVGESLARLFEAHGAQVRRVCYQGDIGLHVAKAVWGMQQQLGEEGEKELEKLTDLPLEERASWLGKAYAIGSKAYEEDESKKEAMHVLNKRIYEKDPAVMPFYETGRTWSLEYFETIYARLGTKFTRYYFESAVGPIGLSLVKEYLAKGVFLESDGAVIFPGKQIGLHNRVFINSLGLPTYEAKELGLNKQKYDEYSFDISLIVTGNEITEYFKVLLAVMKQVIPDVASKTKHISHGMVRLPEGKMSSRTGNVITGEWLLDTAKEAASKKIAEVVKVKHNQLPEETAEMVGVGAVKYALLKSGIGKSVEFSFDESISFEGNAAPYLQYTYVRTRSILREAKYEATKANYTGDYTDMNEEEQAVLRVLARFEEVVSQAAMEYSPHVVATYLFDLSQKFNLFYQKHKVIGSPNQSNRLALADAVGIVLKSGLHLLGIQTPEHM